MENTSIDFVITWVDGSDPEWINIKKQYQPEPQALNRRMIMKQLLSIVAVFAILTFSTVGFAQEEQQSKQPSKAELLKQYAKGAAGVVDYAFDDEGRLIKVVVVGKATISTVLGPRGEIVAERKAAMDCDAQFVQWFKKNMTVTENEDQEAIQRTTGSGNDDEVNREYEAKDSDNYSRVIESKASQVLRGMTPIYSGINPERIDVAAIQLEDQVSPKRCGHERGRSVVSVEDMQNRIRAVVETRNNNGIVLVARTDAYSSLGIDEAIRRANAYLEAGADAIFVESPENKSDIKRVAAEVKGPVLFNNVEGGRSPFMTARELEEYGFRFVIYPNAVTRIVSKKIIELLQTIKETGTTEPLWGEMLDHKELWELFGSEQFYELENRYSTLKR